MNLSADTPFNQLPNLPPRVEIETKQVLKKCIDAKTSLVILNQVSKRLPNTNVLINTLPLLEAQTSSEIENIITTTDKLFQYSNNQSSEQLDTASKEVLRYRTALRIGFEQVQIKPSNTVLAENICSVLRNIETKVRKVSGTTLLNAATGEVIYTPPVGEVLIREKLSNWEKFMHEQDRDLDPLIKMAIGHYQFEAIHPFTDGNGRTGRILNILYLVEKNLIDLPILYLSRYIMQNKNEYYKKLLNVTLHQEWEAWILFMLEAIDSTSKWSIDKISNIIKIIEEVTTLVKNKLPKIYSRELIEIIFTQPYCRVSNLTEANIAKRQTASEYLKKLVSENILEEKIVGREKIFINKKFMQILI